MFNITCWNIKGLNDPLKQREVKKLIKDKKVFVCSLVETKVTVSKFQSVCANLWGKWSFFHNGNDS